MLFIGLFEPDDLLLELCYLRYCLFIESMQISVLSKALEMPIYLFAILKVHFPKQLGFGLLQFLVSCRELQIELVVLLSQFLVDRC